VPVGFLIVPGRRPVLVVAESVFEMTVPGGVPSHFVGAAR